MIRCRHLNPCFPHRVVQSLSMRDRRLYVFFHGCLWTGVITFAIGTALYAALQTYAFFIMALPCVCIMFVGQFGFRWLAVRNEDKFDMCYPPGEDAGSHGMQAAGCHHQLRPRSSARLPGAPPPPVYSEVYDGPIFTIDGTLAPPPEYAECVDTRQQQQLPASVPVQAALKREDGDEDRAPSRGGERPNEEVEIGVGLEEQL